MNIHFSELLLILLVALLVIKPERLPGIAMQVARWLNGLRQIATKLKNEFELPKNHE